MAAFFALTLFVGSALLFLVEPMIGRMVLPLLGGSPAVWNTCMVFFQAALLAGYAYAHLAPAALGLRRQALLHLGLLLLPLLVLPVGLPRGWSPPDSSHPVPWLLGLLLVSVGLPFFVVASSAPLLQKWFAGTGHPGARNPYFLYGASNLGSLLALLAYPLVLEPLLPLADQRRLWSAGYLVLVALTAGCAAFLWRRPTAAERTADSSGTADLPEPETGARLPWVRWLLLAFAPSSLMLSVTTYVTADVAAIPLLWVLPLALYLLSFVLAFARRPLLPHALLARWMPLMVLLLALVLLSEATEPVELLLGLHLLGLFWIALVCHGELAHSRPPARHLTAFYLWVAGGGVLGGLFSALAAPLLFSSIAEYPLVLVLACLVRPPLRKDEGGRNLPQRRQDAKEERKEDREGSDRDGLAGLLCVSSSLCSSFASWRLCGRFFFSLGWDLLPALGLGGLTTGLVLGAQTSGLEPGPVRLGVMFGLPAVLCYTLGDRPARFGLGLGALLLAGALYPGVHGRALYRERDFFGVHRVTVDPTHSFRELVHGNTVHGRQSLDPARRHVPLTYYHPTGPIGQVFRSLRGDPRLERVALVGLGAGSLACYAEAGQHWTYFEIDPAVVGIARNPDLFTFYTDCPARLDVVLGDARLTLARSDERFGLLVVDAFNSDAIPLSLLTREALRIYRDRLREDGLLAFNISNRYLDLAPVLADLAADARPPLVCLLQEDLTLTETERAEGKSPSQWVVMASNRAHLGQLAHSPRWRTLSGAAPGAVWTDDYANLLGAFKWREER